MKSAACDQSYVVVDRLQVTMFQETHRSNEAAGVEAPLFGPYLQIKLCEPTPTQDM